MVNEKKNLIWYASYGSNICHERFLCYIIGGKVPAADRIYLGCQDKSFPVATEEIYIQSALYFAKSSSLWGGGGVGFLKNGFGGREQSMGRMYLITQEQFKDVVRQETIREVINIDFDYAIESGGYVFAERSWYGRIVYIGTQDQYPIFTFTNEKDLVPTKPAPEYLNIIGKGIKEVYPLTNEEIADYFLKCDGINNCYKIDELRDIINT